MHRIQPSAPDRVAEDEAIAATLLALCARRAAAKPGATICPSEVARVLWPDGWRAKMEAVRRVGRALAREGAIEVCQGGRVLDPIEPSRGAIRYRLRVGRASSRTRGLGSV